MKKQTKNRKEKLANIDFSKSYNPVEAIKILKNHTFAKFDETLEIAINLKINSEKTDQNIRGVINLPKGSGKSIRVAVMAKDDKAKQALAAGADAVMIGSLFAGTNEAPGKLIKKKDSYIKNLEAWVQLVP